MITITNNQLFVSHFGINNTNKKYITQIQDFELCNYLNDNIEFSDDLLFNRLFDLLIINKDIINIIFNRVLNDSKIEDWLIDYNSISNYNDKFDLSLGWYNDLFDWNDKLELTSYTTLSSFEDNVNEYDRYGSINFLSLSSLKNKKILLNNNFIIKDVNNSKILECHRDMTLYDVIYGILKEICFHGTPENRDSEKQKLIDISDRIDRGEEKLYTSDEVKEMIKERLKDKFDI